MIMHKDKTLTIPQLLSPHNSIFIEKILNVSHIKSAIPGEQDQRAENAVNTALTHLDQFNTYVRDVDYRFQLSLLYNFLQKWVHKLSNLG